MLGVNEQRKPVKAPFTQQMQKALLHALTGNFDEKEKEQALRDQSAASRFVIEWK